ncbi:hypothetical protein [Streptomyces hirsutus]|uniref:hypothetical protein n=1 Tax=Streptomyces hirsutus TaxID=35620 RepID=UPI003681960B
MATPDTSGATFAAACALVRTGAAGDEDGLRALIDTRDTDELVGLVLATGALAQLLGLVAHGGDPGALDAYLTRVIANQQP